MIDKIKQFFWDNAVLRWVINACSWAKNYALYQLQFAAASSARSKDPAYSQIAQFKDLHKGERCFILATGPSLTAQDVQKLEHEFTFGMNSICLLFDALGWETTYYGIQYYGVYEKGAKEISFERAILIAKYYGVSLDYIAGLTNNKKGLTSSDLTDEQQALLKFADSLSESERKKLSEILKKFLDVIH